MPGWVEDLLKEMFYGPFYQLAKVVWDWCIGLSTGVIRDSVSLGNGNRIIHDECLFHLCVFKSSFQFKREHHLGALCGRNDPAGGIKCVDADGNEIDENPVFYGSPDGRDGTGFPGTGFLYRGSGCRKRPVLVVYGIFIFLCGIDLWNADLFNFI